MSRPQGLTEQHISTRRARTPSRYDVPVGERRRTCLSGLRAADDVRAARPVRLQENSSCRAIGVFGVDVAGAGPGDCDRNGTPLSNAASTREEDERKAKDEELKDWH